MMLKKLDRVLNIFMASSVGVLLGDGIYTYWDYTAHPGLYAMRSAPWYAGVLVCGVYTVCVLIVGALLKLALRRRRGRRPDSAEKP